MIIPIIIYGDSGYFENSCCPSHNYVRVNGCKYKVKILNMYPKKKKVKTGDLVKIFYCNNKEKYFIGDTLSSN